jgi:hypothetical protein
MPTRSTNKNKSKNKSLNNKTLKLRAKLYKLLSTNPEKFHRMIDNLTDEEIDLVYGKFKNLRL